MKSVLTIKTAFIGCLAWGVAALAQAGWMLNPSESDFNFASIKKNHVYETHTFNRVSGQIDDKGKAELMLDLTSVNTGIGIRDERMQSMLFDTAKFTSATYSLMVDAEGLKMMPAGARQQISAEGMLSLFGTAKALPATLNIYKLSDNRLLVSSAYPVVVQAADFGLDGGVEALREIAGLPAISQAVPVTFSLVFELK